MGTEKIKVDKKKKMGKFSTILCLICLLQVVQASLNVNQSSLMSPFEM